MIWDILGPAGIVLLILLWVFEGFTLKYIDQIVDEGRNVAKIVMWAVMAIAGVFGGFFMTTDAFTGGSVFALVLGMILAKKIDNKLWFYQIVILFGAYIFFINIVGILTANFFQLLIIMMIVLVFSILDEIVHDACQKAPKYIRWFGDWRFIMKIVVVIMAIFLPFVMWYHAVAWILFDLTYEFTARILTPKLKGKVPKPLEL
jgi:hypothetical protein